MFLDIKTNEQVKEYGYKKLDYAISPIGNGILAIYFICDHEIFGRYCNCDGDYLRMLGRMWESHGEVHIAEID